MVDQRLGHLRNQVDLYRYLLALSGRRERASERSRRSGGTGVYKQVHEDAEHRRTLPGGRAVGLTVRDQAKPGGLH